MAVGIIDTGSYAKRLWPGVKTWYGLAYDEYPPEYTDIFDVLSSDKAYEDIVSQSGVGLPVVLTEAGSIQFFSPKQGFTSRYVNTQYGIGFIISKIVMDDDQYAESLAEGASRSAAMAMRQAKEIMGANIINNSATYTAGPQTNDGVAFASNAHLLYGSSGGTYSNVPSIAAGLSEASLEQALIDIAAFVNDAGLKIHVKPKTLVIPPQLLFQARRLMLDDDRPGTANRDINASKGMLDGYVVNHYLTSPSLWMIRNDVPNSMLHLKREGFEMESDYDFLTSNVRYKFTERYAFGTSDARGAYIVAA